MKKNRVRFAPSPTGNLHVGSARIALFNFLFAKAIGAENILRIEDTDFDRSADVFVENILEGLSWLGITYDDTPIRQSGRRHIYQEYAEKILAQGKVYRCYCTEAELTERRKIALALGKAPKYDGRCRNLSTDQIKQFEAENRQPAIRFMVDDRKIKFHDLVRGELEFDGGLIGDFVIIKSNGFPSYNFAAVVDDALMQISHCIRGEDHISNTPKQILLYEALGFTPPQFAHISMILGPDRTKLSKRHGAKSISEFRDEGFLAEAMLNFLMLLSWSPGENREIISVIEAAKIFRLEDITKSPAIFDVEKLKWLNGQYIRSLPSVELTRRCLPFLQKAALPTQTVTDEVLVEMVDSVKDNLVTLADCASYTALYFAPPPDESALKEILFNPDCIRILDAISLRLPDLLNLDQTTISDLLNTLVSDLNIKKGLLFKTIRLALTGKTAGPEMWRIIRIFGKAKCLSLITNVFALKKV